MLSLPIIFLSTLSTKHVVFCALTVLSLKVFFEKVETSEEPNPPFRLSILLKPECFLDSVIRFIWIVAPDFAYSSTSSREFAKKYITLSFLRGMILTGYEQLKFTLRQLLLV